VISCTTKNIALARTGNKNNTIMKKEKQEMNESIKSKRYQENNEEVKKARKKVK
jgi:hypothetical protein